MNVCGEGSIEADCEEAEALLQSLLDVVGIGECSAGDFFLAGDVHNLLNGGFVTGVLFAHAQRKGEIGGADE